MLAICFRVAYIAYVLRATDGATPRELQRTGAGPHAVGIANIAYGRAPGGM